MDEILKQRIKKAQKGNSRVLNELVIENQGLVYSIAKRFLNRGYEFEDITQIGFIGFIKAVKKFNFSYDVSLSTFAVSSIIGEIKRFMRDSTSMRVSRSIRDTAYQILKCREKYAKEHKTEPSLEQISTDLGISVKEISFALDALSEPMSMYDPVYKDGSETVRIMDQIGDSKNNQDEWIENFALKDALKKLSAKEKQIVLMRYYLGKTQIEVSNEVGISQAQVSRLEKEAIKSMRKDII